MNKFEVFCDKYVSHFTYKTGEKRGVGLEKEIIITDENGYMADISKSIWPYLGEQGLEPIHDSYYKDQIVGFWYERDQIALDAGRGTMEIILDPCRTVIDAEKRMKEVLSVVLPVCEKKKLKMLSIAMQPRTKAARENWNHKQRYEVLLDYLGEPIYAASLSASDQVHVDVVREDLVPVTNVMNGFAGFFVVLFANCPVFEGPNQFKAFRELIWDDLGHDRTGLPLTPIKSFEDYLERTWNMDCIIAAKDDKFYSPGMKFKEYVKDMSDDEVFEAYKIHEGTIWFDARPRIFGTVEMRPAGLQPWNNMVCVAALSLGLLENLNESEMFLKDFRWDMLRELRIKAVEKGFNLTHDGKPIADFVEQVLLIAKKGLQSRERGEEKYLDPLFERVRNKKSPADIYREYLRQGGMELLLDRASLKSEHLKI